MKSPGYYLRGRKAAERKQKLHERAMRGVAARERNRMAAYADCPAPELPCALPIFVMTIIGRNAVHRIAAFPAKRRNSLRVTVDAKPWRDSIGLTRLCSGLRKRLLAA